MPTVLWIASRTLVVTVAAIVMIIGGAAASPMPDQNRGTPGNAACEPFRGDC